MIKESNLFDHTFLIVVFDFMEKSIGLTENELVNDQRVFDHTFIIVVFDFMEKSIGLTEN